MFTPRFHFQRLIVPFLFTALILPSGCSDDDPARPAIPATDISGVVRDQHGGPASGATVYLGLEPYFRPQTATIVLDSVLADNTGRYEFDGLDVGSYQVYAGVWNQAGGGFALVSPFTESLAIAAEETAKSAGHIADLSLLETAHEGVVAGEAFYRKEPDLVPADSTTVTLHRYEGAEFLVVAETTTNADGRFALAGVQTGNFTVTAVKIMRSEAPFPIYVSAASGAFFCDGNGLVKVERLILEDVMVEKPAVYIYPEQAGQFQVELELGTGVRLTASEPDYGTGWDVYIDEAGRIDATWDYLFYEIAMPGAPMIDEGWCLSWSGMSAGLESICVAAGLNAAEQDDFLDYWLSRLPPRNYYEIHPVFGGDLDAWVRLDTTPAPQTVVRFWLFFRGRDTATELTAPVIPLAERIGTTVVEWGGAVIP